MDSIPNPERHYVPVDLEIRITTHRIEGAQRLQYVLASPSGAANFHYKSFYSPTIEKHDSGEGSVIATVEKFRRGLSFGNEIVLNEEIDGDLAALGRYLFSKLFPQDLKNAYWKFRDLVCTLQITSDEFLIPWELVKPYSDEMEDDFFCVRFQLSRWLAGQVHPPQHLRISRLVCISAENPERLLPSTKQECDLIGSLAEETSEMRSETHTGISFEDLMSLLEKGNIHLLHFAGHGALSKARLAGAGIELGSGRSFRDIHLTGPMTMRLRRDRPLVFFNTCQGAQMVEGLAGLSGWPQAWINDCHCGAFIAPVLRITDHQAFEFAKSFYRKISEGRTLGEAVLETRRQLRDLELAGKGKGPKDFTWLAYCLYAHPNARITFGRPSSTVNVARLRANTALQADASASLKIPSEEWDANLSPPGALLEAKYGVVPFHGRDQELEELFAWCREEIPLEIRLYTGKGGMGKTRFAIEACRFLREQGWVAGFLGPIYNPEEIQALAQQTPLLVVQDYAESQRERLSAILTTMRSTKVVKMRFLLLARNAQDWWNQLKTEGGGAGELLSSPAAGQKSLGGLALELKDRQLSFDLAFSAFAERLGAKKRSLPEYPPVYPKDLEAPYFQRALFLHMSALAAVEGVDVVGEDGLLDCMLNREKRYWRRLAVERSLPPRLFTGISRAVAAFTLGGGVETIGEAIDVLGKLRFFTGQDNATLTAIGMLLHDCYPGDQWIEPIQPDLLGEHLVMRELENGADELLGLLFGERDGPGS